MTASNERPAKAKSTAKASPDTLAQGGKRGAGELREDNLSEVSGGNLPIMPQNLSTKATQPGPTKIAASGVTPFTEVQ
jgi:hypothetical protein